MKRLIGLRILVPIISLALLALAIVVASHFSRSAEQDVVRESVLEQLRERLNHFQISAELFSQLGLSDHLQQLIASIAAEPDLQHILIADPDGRIIAANRYSLVGEYWRDVIPSLDPAQIRSVQQNQSVSTFNTPDSHYIDGYSSMCGHADHSVLRPSDCGFIAYRVDLDHHIQRADKVLNQQTLFFSVGIIGVVLLLLLALDFLITRRARRITTALSDFSQGERERRIPVDLHDEISWISATVNRMLDEVQRNERDILDQRERLRAVFDTVADAIITINSRGIIQTVNPATEQLFDYEPGELIGQNVAILTPAPIRGQHDQYINNYLETGQRKIIGIGREVKAVAKDGSSFAAELTITEMSIGGERMFTGVIRDVSERVALREAMEQVNAELISTNQSLWKSAKTDGLTGLANRRHFDDTLEAELRRATRHGHPLSLLLIDLDFFKAYNDTYGHLAGDKCLQGIAKVLTDSCQRSGELPARYGGEEFAVILPDNQADQAFEAAERIRQCVLGAAIPHGQSQAAEWVTTSIGVTSYSPADALMPEPQALIRAADHALYKAKAEGRNRVCQTQLDELPIEHNRQLDPDSSA